MHIKISDIEKLDGDVQQAKAKVSFHEITKMDLFKNVSAAVGITHKKAEVVMEAILDTIVRTLRGGDKVEIRRFGSFRTRPRLARIGRNPKTGARVEVPACTLSGPRGR